MAEVRPQVVYSDVAEGANLGGQLFAGKKFFIAQRCPMRSSFVEQVKSNGGNIVPLEKLADYLIVDHMRKDIPAGSISYTFVEQSIRNGKLEVPDDHRAGEPAGTVREIGSFRPTKSSRVPYTAEDDRQLYNWIKDYEREGGAIMGNEIYKQLEQKNPRHPWQSWRDRYVKQLQYKPPPGCAPANGPLSPPSDVPPSDVDLAVAQPVSEPPKAKRASRDVPDSARTQVKENKEYPEPPGGVTSPAWTKEDWDELYNNADVLREVPVKQYLEGWERWASGTKQSAEQWRHYFEKKVLPRWERDQEQKAARGESSERNTTKEEGQRFNGTALESEVEIQEQQKAPSPQVVVTTPRKDVKPHGPSLTQKGDLDPATVEASPSALQSPVIMTSRKPFEGLVHELMAYRKGQAPMAAYRFYFEAHRHEVKDCSPTDYSAPHRKLNPRWKSMAKEDQAPYYEMEAADKERYRLENNPAEYRAWRLSHAKTDGSASQKRHREEENELEESQESPDVRASKRPRSQDSEIAGKDDHLEEQDQHLSAHDEDEMEQEQVVNSNHEALSLDQHAQQVFVEITDDSDSGLESEEGEDAIAEELLETVVPSHRIIDLSDVDGEIEEEDHDDKKGHEEDEEDETNSQTITNNESNSASPPDGRQSLSRTLETQAILADATQVLDVDLAEIADDSSQPPTSSLGSSPFTSHNASDGTSHSIREFRSLQNLERHRDSTPPLDLDMPLPELDSDAESYSQDSESVDHDPPLDGEGAAKFYHKMLRRGYEDELIRDVMRSCMVRAKLSEEVLGEVAHGESWPQRRGVWTDKDDCDLESTDAKRVRRVIKKHTDDEWGGCEERRRVLDYIRRVSEQHG